MSKKSKAENINYQSTVQKLKSCVKHPVSLIFFILIAISVVLTVASLGFLIGYILVNGIPNITWDQFEWKYTTDNASMMPAIINTLIMTVLALIISIPLASFLRFILWNMRKKEIKL